jgi:hypothetical protein
MKNRHELGSIFMLLPLLLFFCPAAVYTQTARNLEQEIGVSFTFKEDGSDLKTVVGEVRNKTANTYPCVRLEFDLYGPARPAGEPRRRLGVLPVLVQNLPPRGVRNYERQLPYRASVVIKSVTDCPPSTDRRMIDAPKIFSFTVSSARISTGQSTTLRWHTENTEQVFVGEANPGWPRDGSEQPLRAPRSVNLSGSLQVSPTQTTTYRLEAKKRMSAFQDVTVEVTSAPPPPTTCTITGRITGKLRYETEDDRGQPGVSTLTHIIIKTPGVDRMRAQIRRDRTYTFENVPAGKTYTIFPDFFRSRPQERNVLCQPNGNHTGMDFHITNAPPSG